MPPVLAALGLGGAAAGGTAAGAGAAGTAAGLSSAGVGAGASLAPTAAATGGAEAFGPLLGAGTSGLWGAAGPTTASLPALNSSVMGAGAPSLWNQVASMGQQFGQGLGQGTFGGNPQSGAFQLGNRASSGLLQGRSKDDKSGAAFVNQFAQAQLQRHQQNLRQLGIL